MTMLHVSRRLFRVGVLALATAGLLGTTPFGAQAQDKEREKASRTAAKTEKSGKTDKASKARTHKVAIQVNDESPDVMNLALNNARNVVQHYKALGEAVQVEVVAFGPGLHMLRNDTSPVKQRIAQMSLEEPSISFAACSNTHTNMQKREEKPITLISEAKIVPSGVVRLMELQKLGYAYIRP
jgi:uncharacterized protein